MEGFAKGITLDDVVHCPSFDLPQENHIKTSRKARSQIREKISPKIAKNTKEYEKKKMKVEHKITIKIQLPHKELIYTT